MFSKAQGYVLIAGLMMASGGICSFSATAPAPTLEQLQDEWAQIFPSPQPVATLSAPSPESFSILHKEFLFIRPEEIKTATLFRSWETIRNYPAPLRRAHAACVKIITPGWHGAGIVVSPHGDILTSYHLLAGMPGACVMTLEGQVYSLTNIASHSAIHDLALLKIPVETPVYLPVADGSFPPAGTALSIIGHPGDITWKLSTGVALRHFSEGQTSLLHFESDIGRGNSGGPVIDPEGRLCGITACAARLADGSSVKAGVDITAIREFMATPEKPISFTHLASLDRNWKMAQFLGNLSVVMDMWMHDWLVAMASVSLSTESGISSKTATLRLSHTRDAGETSIKMLLLRTLFRHCEQTEGLDPRLYLSMAEAGNALEQVVEGTEALQTLSHQPDPEKALKNLAGHRSEALHSFGRSLATLEETGRALEETTPPGPTVLQNLCEAYPVEGGHAGSTLRAGQGWAP